MNPTTHKNIRRLHAKGWQLRDISVMTGASLPEVRQLVGGPLVRSKPYDANEAMAAQLRADGHAERVIRACCGEKL